MNFYSCKTLFTARLVASRLLQHVPSRFALANRRNTRALRNAARVARCREPTTARRASRFPSTACAWRRVRSERTPTSTRTSASSVTRSATEAAPVLYVPPLLGPNSCARVR